MRCLHGGFYGDLFFVVVSLLLPKAAPTYGFVLSVAEVLSALSVGRLKGDLCSAFSVQRASARGFVHRQK